MSRSRRCGFPFLPLALALGWFALSPKAGAVDPPPDGGYPQENTAEGEDALFNLTTGANNTATGFEALFKNATGSDNTALGDGALFNNRSGSQNTATGYKALYKNYVSDNTAYGACALMNNTGGNDNTAVGHFALQQNTIGLFNTATGSGALTNNTGGASNTADGFAALFNNTTGIGNTANGSGALNSNTTGFTNTATGNEALELNRTGSNNTAVGSSALLFNIHGNNNIALGYQAGTNLTKSDNNIDIGNVAVAGDANTIRIGTVGTHNNTFISGISGVTVAQGVSVVIDNNGQLGTITSSERFKEAIKPMDEASEVINALQPVTFRYKHELDPDGIPQFGLVAEEVEKVNPALVVRDASGKPYTVRYEAVNAMLLNEFLKAHRKVEALGREAQNQEAIISRLKSAVAQQQKISQAIVAQQEEKIDALTARLDAQELQIREVSGQATMSNLAARMVNDQ